MPSVRILSASAVILLAASASFLNAAGVMVGNSSLIGQLDYSDTFTGAADGGRPDRSYLPGFLPPTAFFVEKHYNSPPAAFEGGEFRFASDGPNGIGLVSGAPGHLLIPNSSGAGSASGITQSLGSVKYGVRYGFRLNYIVQVDAVQVPDRIEISTGDTISPFNFNSLSVQFRGDGSGNALLSNGITETSIQASIPSFNTGILGPSQWHNYAVRYDLFDGEIEIYVDEVSRGIINLKTFAGGIYQNFSIATVSVGSRSALFESPTWTDNFQVGIPVPEPGVAALGLLSLTALMMRRRRKA